MEPKYTLDIKKNIVAAIIKECKANPDATPTSVIKSHAKTHNIPFTTVYNWYSLFKDIVGDELGMAINEVNDKIGIEANELSFIQKYKIITETSGLSPEDRGAYCRQHGLYEADLLRWDVEIKEKLGEPPADDPKAQAKELKALKKEVTQLKRENNKQARELDKKDKVLATYAAKVITLRNFQKLFSENNNEED